VGIRAFFLSPAAFWSPGPKDLPAFRLHTLDVPYIIYKIKYLFFSLRFFPSSFSACLLARRHSNGTGAVEKRKGKSWNKKHSSLAFTSMNPRSSLLLLSLFYSPFPSLSLSSFSNKLEWERGRQ
jgi:hypothetical protein